MKYRNYNELTAAGAKVAETSDFADVVNFPEKIKERTSFAFNLTTIGHQIAMEQIDHRINASFDLKPELVEGLVRLKHTAFELAGVAQTLKQEPQAVKPAQRAQARFNPALRM